MVSLSDMLNPSNDPPVPWSWAEPLVPGPYNAGTQFKPAMCEFQGKVFLAWATMPSDNNPPSFSFTHWLPSDNGWAPFTVVLLGNAKQCNTSTMVVFKGVLYLFVPYTSVDGSDSACAIYSYNETNFEYVCDWFSPWCTALSAIVHDDILHVVGYNQSDDDHFIWTYSKPDTTDKFRHGLQRELKDQRANLHDYRSILEITLDMETQPPSWSSNVAVPGESGDSGISATSTPTGADAWICFKTHGGYNNLMCRWERKSNSWTSNQPIGDGIILWCENKAALLYSDSWVYAVWNSPLQGGSIYWSRRPMKHISPENWMGSLDDQSISIAALSIPGTHDSATSAWYNPDLGILRTQDMSITQQLNAGIRYLDLRLGYGHRQDTNGAEIKTFVAVHGNFTIDLTVQMIFTMLYEWLDAHPTEAIIAQIKADQDQVTSQKVSNSVNDLVMANKQYWALGETIPTLNQITGKIQLIRRFSRPDAYNGTSTTFGINATSWPNNGQGDINDPLINPDSPPVSIAIEDHYCYDNDGDIALKKKKEMVIDFISRAVSSWDASTEPNAPTNPTWFIGYTSYVTRSVGPNLTLSPTNVVKVFKDVKVADSNFN
ncbi:plc-like phosphodiesterase [Fusarium phyllophilum]|uniref:Plc-like phosphodiesterase n=1 Tax=Fusarium phyllophilum TaxID=47803 RepID=A0A8H5KCC9_9HYPO|nr:plc-like phosphodiesterase [Fusarium phyllophilum]